MLFWIQRELSHWREFLAVGDWSWADLLRWPNAFILNDFELVSRWNLVAGIVSLAALFWLISGEVPWHLYLFSAFTTPEFQNRFLFAVTLLFAIIFTGLVAGYILHNLWDCCDRKWRWLVRREQRLRERTRTNREYRV